MPKQAHATLEKAFEVSAQNLTTILSDTYILYVKTQNFHWNITDPRFYFLHKMLEEQYEQLAEATDALAERLRMIGHKAPGSMSQFLEMGTLEEAGQDLNATEMLEQLYHNHLAVIQNLRKGIDETDAVDDEGTNDLLIQRLREHEKTAWILRAHLSSL